MKISIELKIGIIGIVTIALVIWGVNFLKGRNILSNSYTLYALYDNAGGIEVSTPVLMNGVKIGYVDQVELNPKEPVPVRVKLNIEKKYSIRRDSWSILFSSDLLGTKAIRIEASDGNQLLRDHDTIQTLVEQGMFASLQDQLEPVIGQIGALAESLDSLSTGLDRILNSETATGTVDNLSAVSKSLRVALEEGGSINQGIKNLESFTAMLKEQEDQFASLTGHLNSISQRIDSAGIERLSAELINMTGSFNTLMQQINSGEGSAGKFFQEDSLYQNLDNLISDLDALVTDLNENPGNYVHISLFGKSQKQN